MLMEQQWFRPVMIGSAVLSFIAIGLFRDGKPSQIVEKGIVGFAISMLVIVGLLIFNWPPSIP